MKRISARLTAALLGCALLAGCGGGEVPAELSVWSLSGENEQLRLSAARESTAAYVAKLKELYQHEMDYLNGLSQMTAPAPSQADQTARDIQSSMEKIVEEETGELPQVEDEEPQGEAERDSREEDGGLYAELLSMEQKDQPEEQPSQTERREHREHRGDRRGRRRSGEDDEEDDSPTRRIDFSNLKFGKDYEIK